MKNHSSQTGRKSINPDGPLLIIDCHNIAHAAKNVVRQMVMGLTNWDHGETGTNLTGLRKLAEMKGGKTTVVFVFLKKLLVLVEQFGPSAVVFAWDSKTSLRKVIYPTYKGKRGDGNSLDKFVSEMSRPQFDILRDIVLPTMGFKNILIQEGYEADDLIAEVCKYRANDHKVIVASDTDLWQLLAPDCEIFDPIYKQAYTDVAFSNKWGIVPLFWAVVKAMAGCSTDNVEGVPMVGEKTAAKFVRGEVRSGTKTFKRIVDSEDIIIRNLKLVMLPFDGVKGVDVYYDTGVDKQGFVEVCNTYSMPSLLEEIHRWTEAFRMK